MTRYLVAIPHAGNYDPSLENEAMHRDIDVLNDEVVTAGVRIFVGALRPASSAKSLRAQPDGKVLITDGPYIETKEHIGGFWVLEAADLNEALSWGRKAADRHRGRIGVSRRQKLWKKRQDSNEKANLRNQHYPGWLRRSHQTICR